MSGSRKALETLVGRERVVKTVQNRLCDHRAGKLEDKTGCRYLAYNRLSVIWSRGLNFIKIFKNNSCASGGGLKPTARLPWTS